ncbi:hypothetical protein [Nonomuraea sp. NPDC048916]|uniref:hypothetical protein n=1 Tax=Nonomuraea sp. NPDC048916 TaxID=3154232 RepID=UPI0033D4145E
MTTQAMTPESARPRSAPTGRPAHMTATPVRVAAAASVLAGLIHYAVIPEHRGEWWGYAIFFTLLGAFEIVWAVAAWTGGRRVMFLGVLVNVAVLIVWTLSRTTGIPIGPHAAAPEPYGALDVICGVAEIVTIGAILIALRGRRPVPGL